MDWSTKILVRSPNWIGDQVLAFPFFSLLRTAHPSARIEVVCSPWVAPLQFKGLVDAVHALPSSSQLGKIQKFVELDRFSKELKRLGPWDLGITLPPSFSAAWGLLRSGARVRRGMSGDGRRLLLNQSMQPSARNHRSFEFARLAREDGSLASLPLEKLRSIPFDMKREWPLSAQQEDEVGAFKSQNGLKTKGFWAMAPGSLAESRRWEFSQWLELGRKLKAELGLSGLILGGSGERALAQELVQKGASVFVDGTVGGSLLGAASLIRDSLFLVSNDSGLAHVGGILGTPLCVVWGGGDPDHTLPWAKGPLVWIGKKVHCWPCERNVCSQTGDARLGCLRGVSVESVWREIQGILPQK